MNRSRPYFSPAAQNEKPARSASKINPASDNKGRSDWEALWHRFPQVVLNTRHLGLRPVVLQYFYKGFTAHEHSCGPARIY